MTHGTAPREPVPPIELVATIVGDESLIAIAKPASDSMRLLMPHDERARRNTRYRVVTGLRADSEAVPIERPAEAWVPAYQTDHEIYWVLPIDDGWSGRVLITLHDGWIISEYNGIKGLSMDNWKTWKPFK